MWALLVACARDDGGDGPRDDDDGGGVAWPDACAAPGPDDPVSFDVTPTQEDFEGFETWWWVPEGARGLQVYFNGGESPREVLSIEQLATMWLGLGSEGFGVVATARTEPGARAQWQMFDPWEQNLDAQRVGRLLDHVRDVEGLPSELPLVMSGFSDGSGMAVTMGSLGLEQGWPVAAVVSHNGAYGIPGDVPTQYHIAELDPIPGVDERVADLAGRGIAAGRVDHPERPLTPEVFFRNPEVEPAQADAFLADLVDAGLVDGDGVRAIPDGLADASLTRWSENAEVPGAAVAEARVRVVWATHRYSAFHAAEECRFVLDALASP